MPKYKLKRRYFDGQVMHPMDAVLSFKAGEQPRTAVLHTGEEVEQVVEEPELPELAIDPDIVDVEPGATLSGMTKGKK